MTDYTNLNRQGTATAVNYDAGLRSFMLKVYNYMTLALLLSGSIAYYAGNSPAFWDFMMQNHALIYVVMFAPLALVIFFSVRINQMSLQSAQGVFWLFAVLNGLSLSFIFTAYTHESIAQTFFISAATFAGMSLFGYTTKRDLTGMGHFLRMGVWGIIIAIIANIWLHSSPLNLAISIIGVGVFTGLTAYDTQKLKQFYYMAGTNAAAAGKYAIIGALNLYLDFINLFVMLLRLTGNRR